MSNQNPFFFVFSLSLSLSLSLFCLGCNEYVEQFWKKQKWEKWEILGIGKIARVGSGVRPVEVLPKKCISTRMAPFYK